MVGVQNNNCLTETLIPYGIELFLRLILAHILTDFVFQPDAWVKNRFNNGWHSKCLICHAIVAGVLTFLFANLWNFILILKHPSSLPEFLPQLWITFLYAFILVTASHFVIDGLKSHWMANLRKKVNCKGDHDDEKDQEDKEEQGEHEVEIEDEPIHIFFIDQIAHGFVLLIVLVLLYPHIPIPYPFGSPVEIIKIWIAIIAFLLILWPSGILVNRITQLWRKDVDTTQEGSLDNAGRLIGYVERILILIFILVNDYTAIGFLVAAKGLFRINDSKRSEYIILGTLLSFAIAVFIGATSNYLINLGGIEKIIQYLSEFFQML